MNNMIDIVKRYVAESADPIGALNAIITAAAESSPMSTQPVSAVQWVRIEDISPNDYNPNSVAEKEMSLLSISIGHDGYTQPIVVARDDSSDKYVIVDGFHRYFVAKTVDSVNNMVNGMLPCVILDKDMAERMAATVRHNRARGKHSIEGMANLVFRMLGEGKTDSEICNALGLEAEELLRIKHITGYSRLYKDHEYSRARVTKEQLRIKKQATEAA